MRNFKEFINEKIAVTFKDKSELKAFLELCGKNNLTWCAKSPAIEPFNRKDKKWMLELLEKSIIHDSCLSFSTATYNIGQGNTIVPATKFLTPTTPIITIFQSGKNQVVCLKSRR